MQKGLPVNLLIAFGLLIVGCFLPWGSLQVDWGSARVSIGGLSTTLPGSPYAPSGAGFTLDISAWNSHATILGLTFPNWLVLGAGAFLAAFGVMECFPHTRVPTVAKGAFSVYGIVHLGALALGFFGGGVPGSGYTLVAVTFLAMVAITISGRAPHVRAVPATS